MKTFLEKLTQFELFLLVLPILGGITKILFEVWIFYKLPEPSTIHYSSWSVLGMMMIILVIYAISVFNLFLKRIQSVRKSYIWTIVLSLVIILYFTLFFPKVSFDIFFSNIFFLTTIIVLILSIIISFISHRLINKSN